MATAFVSSTGECSSAQRELVMCTRDLALATRENEPTAVGMDDMTERSDRLRIDLRQRIRPGGKSLRHRPCDNVTDRGGD
jgi:hypothetical protein